MDSTTKEYHGQEFFKSVVGKIGVAIGMRVVDPDQVHVPLAGGLVGGQQVFGPQLVARGLRAFEGVLQRAWPRGPVLVSPSIAPSMAPQHSLG